MTRTNRILALFGAFVMSLVVVFGTGGAAQAHP